jgi:hypothetical protein
MTEENTDSYDRGHAAGEIAARLAGHDKHFAAINGSLADLATEMHSLTLAVQRLGDQSVARDATTLATAAALREAEEARRSKSDTSWSPWAKVFATIAAVAAALTAIWYVTHLH